MSVENAFALLPSFVLDDSDLTSLELRTYAKISQLCHKLGFCYAKNATLGQYLNAHELSVSRAIKRLEVKGYLKIEIKNGRDRKIYLNLDFKYFCDKENTLTNEQKQPVKSKTEPKEYKDTTEQEKQLKSDDLVLKTTQKTEKREVNTENKENLVLKTDKKPKQKTDLIYELPFYIDSQIFKDFINHRKEIKKPMTQNAVNATIKKLCDFHTKGYDCNEILNNSIANGWQGIFEPQQNRQNLNANKPLIQRLGEQEARILAKYENQNSEMIDCEILEVR